MKKYRIGVDVGGTNVKIALVDKEGSIVYSNTTPTRTEMGYEYTISNIKQAIIDLMKETKTDKTTIEGIGKGKNTPRKYVRGAYPQLISSFPACRASSASSARRGRFAAAISIPICTESVSES